MIDRETLISGPTEKYLLSRLKIEGTLSLNDIYSSYSVKYLARGFMEKVVSWGIAEMVAPGVLGYIKKEERIETR